MLFRLTLTLAIGVIALGAQTRSTQNSSAQPPRQNIQAVQAFLELTDNQIQALRLLRTQMAEETRGPRQEMRQKRAALVEQRRAGSLDETTLAAARSEMAKIQERIAKIRADYRERAVNVLTADQRTKLEALEEAAKLRPTIQQATAIGLLEPPAWSRGMNRMLGPGGFGRGAGWGGPMGPRGMRRIAPQR